MPSFEDPQRLANFACELYRMRRARDAQIPDGLLGEPAWDILLALFAEAPSKVTLSSLCFGSGVPESTGMRWIAALAKMALVERSQHGRDESIVLVSLTAEGHRVVGQSLQAMLREARDCP